MKTKEQKLAAYNEAKAECEKYIQYNGDKRSSTYKILAHRVCDLYMGRMNNFAKQLGLPNYLETFYK